MSQPDQASRRDFLKGAAITGLSLATLYEIGCTAGGRYGFAPVPAIPPEDDVFSEETPPQFPDLRIAYIGTAGIGKYHIKTTVEHGVQCLCYCDVDTARYKNAVEAFPKARAYQDYRKMFDKEHKNIDAVMIGTPDHHHYPATKIAMDLGKHVYTQKPMAHTPWEARELAKVARQTKVVTQMGNQGHALEGWRLIYEWINSGALGQVVEAHSWTDRPIWPQGLARPEGEDAVPAGLDWDLWLGPAPVRPFKKEAYHPFSWRGWWDFGAGALGDMACHTMDGVFWALDPGPPSSIEPIAATPITPDGYPNATVIKWRFPKHRGRPGFDAYWYDGGLKPPFPAELEATRSFAATGNLFIGTKASLLVAGSYGESPRIFPETKMREIGKPPKMLARSCGHVLEWLLASVDERPRDYPKSNFDYAGPMTESVLLGNVALRVGRRLEWDAEKMEFTNFPAANEFVSKEYRAGWKF